MRPLDNDWYCYCNSDDFERLKLFLLGTGYSTAFVLDNIQHGIRAILWLPVGHDGGDRRIYKTVNNHHSWVNHKANIIVFESVNDLISYHTGLS